MDDEQGILSVVSEFEWRRIWSDGEWWFSVVDVIRSWTESPDPARYWRNMKHVAKKHDLLLTAFIEQHVRSFPLPAKDHRLRNTDMATEETLLRLVQSVPSPRAELIKQALARLGKEKIDEIRKIASSLEERRAAYRHQGYPEEWIEVRIAEIIARNELTDTWKERGAGEHHYPMLTNILTEGTFGLTVRSYKVHKSIGPQANLQDNMTPTEIAFAILSKTTAQQLHQNRDSQGVAALQRDVTEAGQVTGQARLLIEQATGQSVVSSQNAQDLRTLPRPKRPKHLPKKAALQQWGLL